MERGRAFIAIARERMDWLWDRAAVLGCNVNRSEAEASDVRRERIIRDDPDQDLRDAILG